MINKDYAWTLAAIQAALALFFSQTNPNLALVFLGGVMLQLNMMNVFRSHKIKVVARDLFEDNARVNELRSQMLNDEEFSQALSYAAGLDSQLFIVFCRAIIEVRNERNRRQLRELSSQYRREK